MMEVIIKIAPNKKNTSQMINNKICIIVIPTIKKTMQIKINIQILLVNQNTKANMNKSMIKNMNKSMTRNMIKNMTRNMTRNMNKILVGITKNINQQMVMI